MPRHVCSECATLLQAARITVLESASASSLPPRGGHEAHYNAGPCTKL